MPRFFTLNSFMVNYCGLHQRSALLRRKLKNFSFYKRSGLNMSSKKSIIAVCQLTSTSDKECNFQTCKSLIETAKEQGATMVFLPECFDYVGENKKQSVEFAESLDGSLMKKYQEIAGSQSLWLSLGGFHEKGPEKDQRRIYNSHVIIDDKGKVAAVYRKCHLFDVSIPSGIQLKESDYVIAGDKVVNLVTTPIGRVGLGICYDMRFPEFSLCLTKAGAEILTYPSAFTVPTGMAHWEALLRARAIESQCYVVAAAQVGSHNSKRASYGHAMIVDPWGCIISCRSEGTGIATAEIDLDYVKKVRDSIPVWSHRRPELYGDISSLQNKEDDPGKVYMFGDCKLLSSQIFYKTNYSMAFVNRKPVLKGHVLISPLRCAKRMSDLSPVEVTDLFNCVQKVKGIVEAESEATSSTIAIQDGPDAGQSVAHVHVHILPRKCGDFKRNDDVYVELESHDKDNDATKFRSNEEMSQEAEILRKYF